MKYKKIIEALREKTNNGNKEISRENLFELFEIIYSNNNEKTFKNKI